MLRIAVLLALFPFAASAQVLAVADITELSLEQLANVTVTTVSRREERLVDAPASIFVLTAEDIRRSGATSLYEVLRLAPNLEVVRGDSSQAVATARGGLSGTANKMLVLVDGRTVYSPLFSGVFSDAQVLFLEDIERIEVISGPGGTLYGTNAVNGVINVISKSAARTQGTLVMAGGGNMQRGAAVRAGWEMKDGGSVRAYGRYFERDAHRLESGASALDEAERWLTGFRADWARGAGSVTVQGETYGANVDNLGGVRDIAGGNVLGRWRVAPSAGSDLFVQAYYDRTEREHAGSFKETRDTFDAEAQLSLVPGAGQRLVLGGGYRASVDHTEATPSLGFDPAERTLGLASLFAQHETALRDDLRATLGVRAERNSYTGVEWLPNARISWSITPDHVVWSALSRAVRSPSRIDRDLTVPGSPPFLLPANDRFESEVANVAELGYRALLRPGLSLSLTAFRHEYRKLRTIEPAGSVLEIMNGARGSNTGVEGWLDWRVMRDWRLVGGFNVMDVDTRLEPGHANLSDPPLGYNPERTASLRSQWNITSAHELDLAWRYASRIAGLNVPSHSSFDARLGWRVSPDLELSVTLTNALDRPFREFGTAVQGAVFERAWFFRATWTR